MTDNVNIETQVYCKHQKGDSRTNCISKLNWQISSMHFHSQIYHVFYNYLQSQHRHCLAGTNDTKKLSNMDISQNQSFIKGTVSRKSWRAEGTG
jgi:hypothetical protein